MLQDLIAPQPNHLIAWVGELTPVELADYLDEPRNRRGPRSRFARDLDRWYDHDSVIAQAAETPSTICELAEANGIEDDELISNLQSRSQPYSPFTAILILWDYKLLSPPSKPFVGGKLECIGSWAHEAPFSDEF